MEVSDRDRVEELSSFYSDDGSREAHVLLNHENKEYEVMMVTCEGKNFTVKEGRLWKTIMKDTLKIVRRTGF